MIDAKLEARMREFLDKEEIREVLLRYCRGVDRCDRDMIATCYHPDAVDDHGDWVASGLDAPDHIVKLVKKTPLAGMHFLGNHLIEIEGDVAWSESYFQAFKDFERDGKRYVRVRAARYVDRFERRNEAWKIAERVLTDDWNKVDEVLELLGGPDRFRFGNKDKNDPVYLIRKGRVARQPHSDLDEVVKRRTF